jgi:predicted nuclease with TOPRIM domain
MQAENERLKETAKIAIQEIGAWSRKAGKLEAENERLKETIRNQSEQVQHLADNLQEARGEAERLKAWILKIKEYARSISVIVVRYCEDALKEASSVKENQE